MQIITDHKWKNFSYRYDVPEKVLDDQFDYLDEDVFDGFFRYRRRWYHLSEFLQPLYKFENEWHAYHSDSFFSGILIQVSNDGEQYKIATFIG